MFFRDFLVHGICICIQVFPRVSAGCQTFYSKQLCFYYKNCSKNVNGLQCVFCGRYGFLSALKKRIRTKRRVPSSTLSTFFQIMLFYCSTTRSYFVTFRSASPSAQKRMPSLYHPFFAILTDELTACLMRHGYRIFCDDYLLKSQSRPRAGHSNRRRAGYNWEILPPQSSPSFRRGSRGRDKSYFRPSA